MLYTFLRGCDQSVANFINLGGGDDSRIRIIEACHTHLRTYWCTHPLRHPHRTTLGSHPVRDQMSLLAWPRSSWLRHPHWISSGYSSPVCIICSEVCTSLAPSLAFWHWFALVVATQSRFHHLSPTPPWVWRSCWKVAYSIRTPFVSCLLWWVCSPFCTWQCSFWCSRWIGTHSQVQSLRYLLCTWMVTHYTISCRSL